MSTPTHSNEAEVGLLGSLLLDNRQFDQIGDVLPEHFYGLNYGLIFRAIQTLIGGGEVADVITVHEALERQEKAEQVGGLAALGLLVENTPSAVNAPHYADIIRDHALRRRLLEVAGEVGQSVQNPGEQKAGELVDAAERAVFDLRKEHAPDTQFTPITDFAKQALERIDELAKSPHGRTGLATGFVDLDDKTAGLQKGDLIVIAGRPSMGKTALAMNIAEYAVIEQRCPVAFFSLEMPGNQLAMRMLSGLGRINSGRLRTGRLLDQEWPRLTTAVSQLDDAPLFIDDSPLLSPLGLRSRARRLKRDQGDLGLIVVDYLQLMQSDNPGRNENRATEVSSITRTLKALAKDLEVPIIALSQLNRSLVQRPNKRPIMSDLRESGAIEQDADVILFIHRDEVENEETEHKGVAEVIIGKQRNGPTGTLKMAFLGEFTRFENYAGDQDQEHGF